MFFHIILALKRLITDFALERRFQVHESVRVQSVTLVKFFFTNVALVRRDAVMLIHMLLQYFLVYVRLAANFARIALFLFAASKDMRVVFGHGRQQNAAALAHFRLGKMNILAMTLQGGLRFESATAYFADEGQLGRVLVGNMLHYFTLFASSIVAMAALQRFLMHNFHVLRQLAFMLGHVRA